MREHKPNTGKALFAILLTAMLVAAPFIIRFTQGA